jgi:hypothetical protein
VRGLRDERDALLAQRREHIAKIQGLHDCVERLELEIKALKGAP